MTHWQANLAAQGKATKQRFPVKASWPAEASIARNNGHPRPRNTNMEKLARKRTEKVKKPTAGGAGRAEGPEDGRARGLRYVNQVNHRHENLDQTTAQQKYEAAERMAREVDKKGGALPVGLLETAAKAGYAPAIYALANWHIHGKGVKKNHRKAVGLLKKAAAQKHPDAEYDLGVAYEIGTGGLKKDERVALFWYRRAALHGDLAGQAETARCYYHGIGTRQDLAKAARWYAKAAKRGDVESQYALGRAYELGEGVDRSIQRALGWYEKAAAQGDHSARQAVADLLRERKHGQV